MTNKQEMSKGLRDKLWKFFSFSYTHYTLRDLVEEIADENLQDWNNSTDCEIVQRLWEAHGCLEFAMHEAFGEQFVEGKYPSWKARRRMDNDARGDTA